MWRLLVSAAAAVVLSTGTWLVLADSSTQSNDMPDVEGPVQPAEYESAEPADSGTGRSDHKQDGQEKAPAGSSQEDASPGVDGPALLPETPQQARPLKPRPDRAAEEPSGDGSTGDDSNSGDESLPDDPSAEPQPMPGAGKPETTEPDAQQPPLVDGPVLPGLQPPAGKPAVVPAPHGVKPPLPPIDETPADKGEQSSVPGGTMRSPSRPADSPEPTPPISPPPVRRPLTAAQTALRDRVRQVVGYYRSQPLNPHEHTATEVLYAALAFGVHTEVQPPGGKKLNGITYLCWNLPCAGGELLTVVDGRIAPRVGYAFQAQPGQLLAVLALARVPRNYPMRAGGVVRSVADLVEYEKLSCRSGSELSLKLIGLSYYVDEPDWQNDLGQQWSLERMVAELLVQPTATLPEGGTTRLLALAAAIGDRRRRAQPIDGHFAAARQLLERFQGIALDVQNADGSWGPAYFAGRSASRDPAVQLRSTGQMLAWLVRWTPPERLDDPHIVRGVQYLLEMLAGQRYKWNMRALSTRDFAAVMHALDALSAYDERFFKPFEVEPTAQRPGASQTTTAGDTRPTQQAPRTAAGWKTPAGKQQ